MNPLHHLPRRLRRDARGSAVVEFGLLAPVVIAMMLGVLQLGIAVQNYNAVRSVAGDVARHAMVQFTVGQPMTDQGMIDYATGIGEAAPYLLTSPTVQVTDVASPQVANTIEKTLTITYQVPTVFGMLGVRGPHLSYSRPIIVTNS